ncbi:Glucoamylase, intracellular sporulation-specific [Meyerozyma guilliermondii]
MRFGILLSIPVCFALHLQAFFSLDKDLISRTDFEAWLSQQSSIAFRGILANVGGSKTNLHDVKPGAVLASPSSKNPDYYYQWTRDAALTVRMLMEHLYDTNLGDSKTKRLVELYISNCHTLQRLDNLSGKFDDEKRSGLGEPKFYLNSTPFNGAWGRPQSDGPALRSSTIIQYLNLLLAHKAKFENPDLESPYYVYHEIVKPDLEFVVANWEMQTFDLWEEIHGVHLYTSMAHLRSLVDGIDIARAFGDFEFVQNLTSTFESVKKFILSEAGFVGENHLLETPSLVMSGKRGGLDSAIILAALHSHNLEAGNHTSIPFDIDDSKVLQTLHAFVDQMKQLYHLNRNLSGEGIGAALGRYPEDIYNGVGTSEGNPWFLCTASAAEAVYKLVYKLNHNRQDIIIDECNREFFKQFFPQRLGNKISYGSDDFKLITSRMFSYSDSFLQIIQAHVDDQGHISEQFNRYNGLMEGARDLTWSYGAVWNAIRWRKKAIGYI